MQGGKNYCCCGLLFFFPWLATGLNADIKPFRPAPIIVCDESEYFFGAVSNTEVVAHDFILANEGQAPLHISAVHADCGCVISKLTDKTLAPGESTAIKAKLNLKNRSGKQMHRLFVESNDPDQPRFILLMIGTALAPMEILPERIYWGNIYKTAAIEKSCEIRFSENDKSHINSAVISNRAFTVELINVKPRRIYKVIVRTTPPLPVGPFESTLYLATDHPRFPTLEISMLGRVVGDIYTIPEEIVTKVSDNGPVVRSLLVCSGLKKKFKITSIKLPAPEMTSTMRPLAMGGGWRIDLHNITSSPGLDGTSVVISTDCAAAPTISVPIRAPKGSAP